MSSNYNHILKQTPAINPFLFLEERIHDYYEIKVHKGNNRKNTNTSERWEIEK